MKFMKTGLMLGAATAMVPSLAFAQTTAPSTGATPPAATAPAAAPTSSATPPSSPA